MDKIGGKNTCLQLLENDQNQAETTGDLTLKRRESHWLKSNLFSFSSEGNPLTKWCAGACQRELKQKFAVILA